MRITKLEIENFKGLKGKYEFIFKGNFIYLVGENNTCKTSVLEAFGFLRSGLPDKKSIEDIKNKNATGDLVVTATLEGGIKEAISNFSESKYENYVFDIEGRETMILQRSSESRTIKQNNKDVDLDVKKITLWNPETKQFENPSGFDAAIKTLFEAQFVWSDTNPDDIVDFGPTKICGKLLSSIFSEFQTSDKWKEFEEKHKETFLGEDSLSTRTKEIENRITEIFEKQYGSAEIKFDFPIPEATNFFKSTKITVDDGTITYLEEKGSGMQRGMSLAIMQVYAQNLITHSEDSSKTKPLFFFIDEPEISLHPLAQSQLLRALIAISKSQQIFITTHSPFLLRQYDSSIHDLFVFNKGSSETIKVSTSTDFNIFRRGPSLGEIIYRAFGFSTEEFHNELYGELQEIKNRPHIDTSGEKKENIENFFEDNGISRNKSWVNEKGQLKNETLMTYIRNRIHHPERQQRSMYTDDELKESIDIMISLICFSKEK